MAVDAQSAKKIRSKKPFDFKTPSGSIVAENPSKKNMTLSTSQNLPAFPTKNEPTAKQNYSKVAMRSKRK